jgi:hypothetical protein
MERTLLAIACAMIFAACAPADDPSLSPRQRMITRMLREAGSLSAWIVATDTVILQLPESVRVDVSPRVVASPGGFFLCNPIARCVVRVSREGKFAGTFGRAGGGPGEFRSIVTAAADTMGNLYLFDNLLARVTCFDPDGRLLGTIPVRNPFLVRHLCPVSPQAVYLHHAPDSAGGNFLTLAGSGPARSLLPSPVAYAAYYFRGHLEGALVAGSGGTIYETNAYSAAIHRIRGGEIGPPFGENAPGFRAPDPCTGFTTIHALQSAVIQATLVRNLFLVQGKELLLQEWIRFTGPARSIERRLIVYDTTGACLGVLAGDAGHIESSDGEVLLKIHNPPPPPGRRSAQRTPRLPRIVLLRLREVGP